jgi:uncharacterized hydantoinase/oxoprolinase family protein
MTFEQDMADTAKNGKSVTIRDNEYGDRLIEYLEQVIRKIIDFNLEEAGVTWTAEYIKSTVDKVAGVALEEIRDQLQHAADEEPEESDGQYPSM